MTDETSPVPQDDDETVPLLADRKPLLLILGGMSVIALTLMLVLRAQQRKGSVSQTIGQVPMDGDWKVSMEHLAANFDIRLQGIDRRIDELVNDRVAQAAATAAYSMPAEPLNGDNGTPTVERIPPVVATGPESAPPPPAAVSM